MNQIITNSDSWNSGYQKFGLMDRITELGLQEELKSLKAEYEKLTPDVYDKTG